MNLTDNAYNGYKCMKSLREKNASILFNDDPELEKAKYIEWFGCIAEIPDMTETEE